MFFQSMISISIVGIILGATFFYQLNSESFYLCKSRIIAEYIAQEYYDNMCVEGKSNIDEEITSNDIVFRVKGHRKSFVVSWKNKDRESYIEWKSI